MFSIFGVPVDAAYHLVSGFTGILAPVLGGAAAVAAAGAAAAVLGHRNSGRTRAHANGSEAMAVPGTADEA